jgi:hypothetical protein
VVLNQFLDILAVEAAAITPLVGFSVAMLFMLGHNLRVRGVEAAVFALVEVVVEVAVLTVPSFFGRNHRSSLHFVRWGVLLRLPAMKLRNLFRRRPKIEDLDPETLQTLREHVIDTAVLTLADMIAPLPEDLPEVFEHKLEEMRLFATMEEVRPCLCQAFEDCGFPRGWGIHAWRRLTEYIADFLEVVDPDDL